MNFLIISHVEHKPNGNTFAAYSPYVREMNIWLKYVDSVIVIAPKVTGIPTEIEMNYQHDNINLNHIPSIEFTTLKKGFLSLLKLPVLVFVIFKGCIEADHIHLRCPGNIGLLGCLVQVFFPKKVKTVKYAGNWDPKAKQPLSYKFQKWILSNTFLTRNITVLVYGNWKKQTKNIKSFFTATYKRNEIEAFKKKDYSNGLKFVFLGSLVEGKRPLLAIKIVEALYRKGKNISLDVYGDGELKETLKEYIKTNDLENRITLFGNKDKAIVKKALRESHFLILPSKSEGWPKAIAEAMFFGTIPIASSISCVPNMLDYGKRGILIKPILEDAINNIEECLGDNEKLHEMSKLAAQWSQNYTLDVFENEIKKLL